MHSSHRPVAPTSGGVWCMHALDTSCPGRRLDPGQSWPMQPVSCNDALTARTASDPRASSGGTTLSFCRHAAELACCEWVTRMPAECPITPAWSPHAQASAAGLARGVHAVTGAAPDAVRGGQVVPIDRPVQVGHLAAVVGDGPRHAKRGRARRVRLERRLPRQRLQRLREGGELPGRVRLRRM